MLVAVEMAGWLNEANLALQAVVQCYGLLAPLIFYKIPSVAVIQVFFICQNKDVVVCCYFSNGWLKGIFSQMPKRIHVCQMSSPLHNI